MRRKLDRITSYSYSPRPAVSGGKVDALVFTSNRAAAPYLRLGEEIEVERKLRSPGWRQRVLDLFERRHRMWQRAAGVTS